MGVGGVRVIPSEYGWLSFSAWCASQAQGMLAVLFPHPKIPLRH